MQYTSGETTRNKTNVKRTNPEIKTGVTLSLRHMD